MARSRFFPETSIPLGSELGFDIFLNFNMKLKEFEFLFEEISTDVFVGYPVWQLINNCFRSSEASKCDTGCPTTLALMCVMTRLYFCHGKDDRTAKAALSLFDIDFPNEQPSMILRSKP